MMKIDADDVEQLQLGALAHHVNHALLARRPSGEGSRAIKCVLTTQWGLVTPAVVPRSRLSQPHGQQRRQGEGVGRMQKCERERVRAIAAALGGPRKPI